MAQSMELLRLQDLSITYRSSRGSHPVVCDVSLVIHSGEFAALVGQSGCGKTTLLQGVLGLLRANGSITGGKAFLFGEPLSPDEVAKNLGNGIGFIPQNPAAALNPVRRVGKQMEEVYRLKGNLSPKEARTRVLSMLERVQLGDPARVLISYPHQLSGGMAQRVVLAMALAFEPPLLFADEPTSAIDAVNRKELLEMLSDLRKDGMGILFVTHDLNLVRRYADSIFVMKDGAIMERGGAGEVLANPSHEYTRLLVGNGGRA
jgi:ABC-type glutathione transport system ATPase component